MTGRERVARQLTVLTAGAPVAPLLVMFGLNMTTQMNVTAFGILLPDIRDAFHLSDAGILAIVAVAAVVGLAMPVPIAHGADRWNRVRLMLLGAGAFALFVGGTGLAFWVWFLVLMQSGAPLGPATLAPPHNSLIADWYAVPARPRVYGFYFGSNAFGAFLGPILAGLIAAWLGWRAPFLFLTVPILVLVVLGRRLREPVRGVQERAAMGLTDALDVVESPPSFAEGWRTVWKVESLRRIFYALPFLAASLVGFAALASLLYQREFGLDVVQRGWVAAAAEPAQIVGLVIGARVGSRLVVDDPGRIIRFLAVVATVASGLLVVFALAPVLWVTIVVNMTVTAALAAVGSGIYSSLSLAIPPRSRSLGFSMGALWVIPGLIVLPIIGAIADSVNIRVGMLVMVPVFLVGGLLLSTAGRVIDRDIVQVRTAGAARAEVLLARRRGGVKLLLGRGPEVAYGRLRGLQSIDLGVGGGEVVALLGTNGAGKSTLLNAICGIVEADHGAVFFDGRDVTHAPPEEIAALGVTQLPGGRGVFPGLTVKENLRAAGWMVRKDITLREERVDEALAMFPVLERRLDDTAADLSGGQQQMLALSMAFLARPRLLLLDELSLGLAPVVVQSLLPAIEAIRAGGTTVILVEQSVNLALSIAETAYFMEKGEIRFHGPTAELFERPDLLRSVFLGPSDAGAAALPRPRSSTEVQVATTPAPAALDVSGVSIAFGGVHALTDVSLTVAAGEIVGLIGPNGAGKTTLFDVVSGLSRPAEGHVRMNGIDITGMDPARRGKLGLGRSFQDARLFPSMTVEETIAVAMHRWVDVVDPLNAALHLPAWVDSEHRVAARVTEIVDLLGLGAARAKFVRELSTGTRRVLDLACVLAHRPSLVLLDEPSSGIAQREAEALGPLLLRVRDALGASLVVIEHDIPLLTGIVDRLDAMDQGRVIASGPAPDVLHEPMVVASYLGTDPGIFTRSGPTALAVTAPATPSRRK